MDNTLRKDVAIEVADGRLLIQDLTTGFEAECGFGEPVSSDFLATAGTDDPRALAFWEFASTAALTASFNELEEIWRRQRAVRAQEFGTPLERLGDQLAYLCEEIPFYVARRAVYDPARISTLGDLAQLPFLRKSDLRVNFPDGFIPAGTLPPEVSLGLSSGSTSERLQSWTAPRVPPIGIEELYGVRRQGRKVFRTAMFTTPFCTGANCRLGESTMDERIVEGTILKLNTPDDVFAIQPDFVANVFDEILRFETECLMADPVYLHSLGRRALELGLKFPEIEFVLLSFEYGSRIDLDFIRRHVCSTIIDAYGTTEVGDITYGCHRGRAHIREDLLRMEIVRDGAICSPGEIGAVALTHLEAKYTPLVRYLVGDVGAIVADRCDCTFADWPCFELHGCAKDMLWLAGSWVTTRQFDAVVSRCSGVEFYAATQPAVDTIEIAVIPSFEGAVLPSEIVDAVRQAFAVPNVKVRFTHRFEPQQSMKYRLTGCLFRQAPEWP